MRVKMWFCGFKNIGLYIPSTIKTYFCNQNCFPLDKNLLQELGASLQGQLVSDKLTKALYATDASVYRKTPLAVVFPQTIADIKKLIGFAGKHKIGLIPRTAGTSLAGQCVGDGIVVDVSKHFTEIIHLDEQKKQVTVQPGVIRDELNQYLAAYGLFFWAQYFHIQPLHDRRYGRQ